MTVHPNMFDNKTLEDAIEYVEKRTERVQRDLDHEEFEADRKPRSYDEDDWSRDFILGRNS